VPYRLATKEWVAKHQDSVRAKHRQYYQEHRDHLLPGYKGYYATHREACVCGSTASITARKRADPEQSVTDYKDNCPGML
jgi:hypothetical protein